MRTIDKLLGAHIKLAPVLVKRAPTLTLAFDARCKSRLAATLDSGEEVALLLPRGTVLRDGDVLVADDGGLVRVVAAPESVLVVRAPDVADMLKRLGASVDQVEMPFQPETGAYGGGHRHGHDETFAEDYALAQQVYGEHHGHEHHDHAQGHAHDHDHGDCDSSSGHDHGHGHHHAHR